LKMNEEFFDYADYLKFFAMRVAKLRTAKKVSAREMSLAIGLSKSYITQIERKQNLPSMTAFLKICEHLEISPMNFFDDEMENPEMLSKLFEKLKLLGQQELESVVSVVDVILKQKA